MPPSPALSTYPPCSLRARRGARGRSGNLSMSMLPIVRSAALGKLNFYRRGRAENGRHSSQTPRLGRLEGWNTRADSPSGPAVARACATQTTPTRRSRSSTHWSTNLKGTTLQHTIGAPCMRRVSLLTSTLSVRHATRCLRWRRCNRRGWQSARKADGGEAAQTDLWVGRWVRRAYLERVHLSHQLLERACVHV